MVVIHKLGTIRMKQTNSYKDCNSINEPSFDIANIESPRFRPDFDFDLSDLALIKEQIGNLKYDCIIIGSGIQGCGLACHIKKTYPNLKFCIIDENDYLCKQFYERTLKIGQKTLRSPYQHHIAPDGDIQLIDYARLKSDLLTDNELLQIELAISGQRSIVPLDVFWAHTKHILKKYEIHKCSFKSKVQSIEKLDNDYKIITKDQIFTTNKIIVATGSKSYTPSEFINAENKTPFDKVIHCFNIDVKTVKNKNILIVGAGLSSATIIKELYQHNKLTWLIRSEEKYKCTE